MGMRTRRPPGAARGPDIEMLEMLLDYAMIAGAELRLPLFVLLLRAARLELSTRRGAPSGLHGRQHKARIDDCPEAAECPSFAAPALEGWSAAGGEVLNGPPTLFEDR